MELPAAIQAVRPDLPSLGYGLFLAINAASVWGGVFPFLPMGFQTPDILLHFFAAQSLAFAVTFFASAAGTYLFPDGARRFMVKAVAAPYIIGWSSLIGAIYLDEAALALVTAGGVLLGIGSAGFYMLWQRLFASMDAHEGNHTLISGTAWGSIFYFALHLIPVAVTAYLIPLVFLPLFGLAIVLMSRTIDLDQPMFEDVPKEHPRTYKHVIACVWRTALAMGALGFCTGIMRSLATAEPQVGALVNVLSMLASLIAALILLGVLSAKNVHLNVAVSYRVFFPLVTSAFVLLPLLGSTYVQVLAAVLYALWSVVITLMMIQCAQVSRDGGINPVFIYGVFGGIVYALHDVGFMGGSFVEQLSMFHIPSLALVAIVAVYFLGIMYFVGEGGFRSAIAEGSMSQIELLSSRPRAAKRPVAVEPGETSGAMQEGAAARRAEAKQASTEAEPQAEGTTPAGGASLGRAAVPERDDAATYRDRFSKQMARVREHFGLSARETEVAELIARGNSVARIAEMLVVSENTVRTHSKRIYTKLGIHKRQELIELVEGFNPSDQ